MISFLIIIIIIIWDLLLCLFQLLTKLLPFILFQLGPDINELIIIIIWDTFHSPFIKLWVLWLIIDNGPRVISLNLGDNSLSRFIHVVIIILTVSGRSVLDLEFTVLYSLFLIIKARLSGLLLWEISLWWLRSVSLWGFLVVAAFLLLDLWFSLSCKVLDRLVHLVFGIAILLEEFLLLFCCLIHKLLLLRLLHLGEIHLLLAMRLRSLICRLIATALRLMLHNWFYLRLVIFRTIWSWLWILMLWPWVVPSLFILCSNETLWVHFVSNRTYKFWK